MNMNVLLRIFTSSVFIMIAGGVALVATGIAVGALALHYTQHATSSRHGLLARYAQWFQHQLEQVFIDWPVAKCLHVIVASVVVLGAAGAFWLRAPGAVAGIACGAVVPYLAARYLNQRRIRKLSDQLVDALTLCANSLKAGHSLAQSCVVIVEEMPMPIRREFDLVVKQNQLGATLEDALELMAQRIPLDDYRILANAVSTLKQTGGNLVQTFESLAQTITARKRLDDKIRTVTAESRMQGYAGAAAPWFILAAMYAIQPDMVRCLFTEPAGWAFLGGTLLLDLLGLFLILKLARIEV